MGKEIFSWKDNQDIWHYKIGRGKQPLLFTWEERLILPYKNIFKKCKITLAFTFKIVYNINIKFRRFRYGKDIWEYGKWV